MDATTLNVLLQMLPGMAPNVAMFIRDLLTFRGYDLDKLLSTGRQINEQNITHLDIEIARVSNLLREKGGDPIIPVAIPQEAEPKKSLKK